MKKTLLLLAVLALTFTLFGVGIAYAQGSTLQGPTDRFMISSSAPWPKSSA